MTLSFVVTLTADAQMVDALLWWSANRPKAPDRLTEEIDRAIAMIVSQPNAGSLVRNARFPNLRRVLLRKTRRHLYYFHDVARDRIEIVGFWNATSPSPPPL
jgi:plasmid stabilization system protein ParE